MTQANEAAGDVSALIEGANTAFNNFMTDHGGEIKPLNEALNKAAAGTAAPHACTASAAATQLGARKLADLVGRGHDVIGHILHKDGQYSLLDGSCRWLSKPQYQRLMHEQDGSPFGATTAYHTAKLRAAIADARHVFEGQKVAEDVLHYLEQVLAAGAPVPAQTGIESPDAPDLRAQWAAVDREIGGKAMHVAAFEDGLNCRVPTPGAENASIAVAGLAAGAEPVVAPDPFRAAARQAVMHQARADLAQAADAPVAGSEWPAWARDLDKVATDMKQIEVATGNLFSELANILGTVGADTFDQAAAAMAAESAEMVAEAERSVAARSGAIISKLVVEVDTTQLDAALAKAEQLKVALTGLSVPGTMSATSSASIDIAALRDDMKALRR